MGKKVILCVDDEKIVLNSLKEQLKPIVGQHYRIEVAESGEEALSIFLALKADDIEIPLIISDYMMPGMNGDELLSYIHIESPKTIKILLTGQATLDGVVNSINKGNLYRFIAKPWHVADLNLATSEGIKSYEQNRTIESQNETLQKTNQELRAWTEAFVTTLSHALDTRDASTSMHSNRIAIYAKKTAEAINRVKYGAFKNLTFTPEEISELHYAALLHDIGKLGVREHILHKAKRLTDDRMTIIRYKFALCQNQLSTMPITEASHTLKQLEQDYHHLLSINAKDYLPPEDSALIAKLAKQSFKDFDGSDKMLLDEFEVQHLSVVRGNLTNEEREQMMTHSSMTYTLLKGIPWPEGLRRVPEIAATHHEKLDGSGYYNGLKADDILLQARILAIVDIFEALTAVDRPYRKRKTVTEALDVLAHEVGLGQLDGDVFDVFVQEKVYLE